MGFTLATNVPSLVAQNRLAKASTGLQQSLERLSSGYRVNRGADDPAALVISEKQRAQISGLQRAIQNADKATSLVQTAEGALSEINSLLIKVRGLAIDSANAGVNDADAQAANQAEIVNVLSTIDRIARNTQFGTKSLLDGTAGINGVSSDTDVTFLKATSETQRGTYSVEVTTPASRAVVVAGTGQTAVLANDELVTINGVTIPLEAGLSQADLVTQLNSYSSQTGVTADVSAGKLRLYSSQFGASSHLSVTSNQAATVASSGLGITPIDTTGTDIVGKVGTVSFSGKGNTLTAINGPAKGVTLQLAADPADPTKTVTGVQGNVAIVDNSLVFQIGPNPNQSTKISIPPIFAKSLGTAVQGNVFNSLAEIDVTNAANAQDSLSVIDAAISDVTLLRGEIGSFQGDTLESTANNLRTTLENTSSAESTIRDTDFAAEIANFTRMQILVQAGTSVLSSANQIPAQVLSLLNRT